MSDFFGLFFPFMEGEAKEADETNKKAGGKRVIRGVSFNAYQNNPAPKKNLERLIKTTSEPHFLSLQEMYTDADISVRNYRTIVQSHGNPRDANCMLLVRDDVELGERRDINVNGNEWIGPKHGLRQPPRYFPGQTLIVNGQPWDVWSVHRCTNGQDPRKPLNMKEWQAEHRDLIAMAGKRDDRKPQRPGLYVGDWNNVMQDRRRFSIHSLAKEIGAQTGNVVGIDGVINWNCRVTHMRKLADKFGSDHHRPVVFMAETR